ncbi:MAG: hypothetical protein EOO73_01645 [Myxococcales bacterium]|nr:MAG: hypothetical protein EOO73_01645 [Myxococcales bacterium]
MRLRFLVPMLGVVTGSFLAAACTTDDPNDSTGEGGAGGEATTPEGGSGGSGAVPGSSGAAGDVGVGGECGSVGAGTLVIQVTGLPEGVAPDIDITGPDELNVTEATELEGVDAGSYTITADRVFDEDPLVRTVFEATVTTPELCLADGGRSTIKVTYKAIPTSNKLWMPTAMADEGAAFTSEALAASGTKAASVSIDGGIGKSIAFDRDGNLWTLGPTLDFPHVLRFPAASLGASGKKEPDVSFNIDPEVVECLPAMRTLALDASGNLWLSACGDQVLRVPAEDLTGVDGTKTPDILVLATPGSEGIAFDKAGNLWVGGGAALLRWDASRFEDWTGAPPDLELTVEDSVSGLKADFVTFDKAGNLWGTDFAANGVFQIAASDLEGTGAKDVTANVSIIIDVLALLHQPAFDEGNGLWLGLDDGSIGRLSPAQLGADSTGIAPSVVIKSSSIGAQLPIAFFPAPQGLPLYHSIPEE